MMIATCCHHHSRMCEHYFRASLSIIPHSAVGALTPNPRNENPDICNIIEHIELLAIIAMSVG